jgi:hypothetical protein
MADTNQFHTAAAAAAAAAAAVTSGLTVQPVKSYGNHLEIDTFEVRQMALIPYLLLRLSAL